MICLSKADEHSLRHLSFNQSPPALSARKTTCQDLNGIANLREHVASNQDDGGTSGILGQDALDDSLQQACRSPERRPKQEEVGQWVNGPFLTSQKAAGGDGQPLSPPASPSRRITNAWGWAYWILSVLVASSVLSYLKEASAWTIFSSHSSGVNAANASTFAHEPAALFNTTSTSKVSPMAIPLHKRSTCASGGIVDKDEYNMPLHVGALFIILFVSFSGCAFPILATKFPGLRIPERFFFVVRHFGTGVLIATAFVHLLPTAFISLSDPCLSAFWTKDYPAMPGAIALASVFFVTIVEMVFHPARQMPPEEINAAHGHQGCMANVTTFIAESSPAEDAAGGEARTPQHPIRDMGTIKGRQSSVGQNLTQLSRSLSSPVADISREQSKNVAVSKAGEVTALSDEESHPLSTPSARQLERKDRLQCILLEMGILFHSVFIGMALSVSLGNEFIILLIAISFHQTFEGLALGSRIAAVKWEKETIQPWLMALAYGCTTPIGQAIGLATHTLYSPDSEVGLVLVGVMNAISAGLLTFASLVELLSEDFLSDASWRYLRGKQRVFACLLVLLGAFGMSLVGAWA